MTSEIMATLVSPDSKTVLTLTTVEVLMVVNLKCQEISTIVVSGARLIKANPKKNITKTKTTDTSVVDNKWAMMAACSSLGVHRKDILAKATNRIRVRTSTWVIQASSRLTTRIRGALTINSSIVTAIRVAFRVEAERLVKTASATTPSQTTTRDKAAKTTRVQTLAARLVVTIVLACINRSQAVFQSLRHSTTSGKINKNLSRKAFGSSHPKRNKKQCLVSKTSHSSAMGRVLL
jgi:hypothetical protein